MRLLIDGNNLLGCRPDGWWRDRDGAKARLATALSNFATDEDLECELFFDGRADERVARSADPIPVSFAAGARDAADHAIAERVEADPDPASIRVITSDRELAARVRAAGATVGGSGAFRDRLERRR